MPGSNPLTVAPLDGVARAAWETSGNGPSNPQELNRYTYALNNPVRYTDPTGHCVLFCILLGAAGTAVAPGPGTAAGAAAGSTIDVAVMGVVTAGVVGPVAVTIANGPAEPVDGSVGSSGEFAGAATGDAPQEATENTPLPRGGTYVLKDPVTGEVVRSGRTNNLQRRQAEHARDPNLADTDFDVDARTDDYAQQRGREQYLHEKYQPRYNRVRGIDPRNRNRESYERAGRGVRGKY